MFRFASGGMASLYAARLDGPDGFQKLVAIKVMHRHLADDKEFTRMFIDEARLVSRITHPNVVQILELGKLGSSHYIVMEYINGESVLALLRRSSLGFTTGVQVAAASALGLHAAHELRDMNNRTLDVVHRDVSPDNILVSYDGSAVKVADFGVARVRDGLHTTLSGAVKGKLSYMAPEQALGRVVDRRADVFSLGIVLYEMTTGRRLFRRPTEAQALQAVIRCRVPPPSKQVSGYPRALEQIVLKALRRNPDHRFQTALALHQALAGYLLELKKSLWPDNLGRKMATVFPDRIRRKGALLRGMAMAGRRRISIPSLEPATEDDSVELLVVGEGGMSGWVKALLCCAIGAFAVGLIAGLGREEPQSRAEPTPPVKTITVSSVTVEPPPRPAARMPDATPGRRVKLRHGVRRKRPRRRRVRDHRRLGDEEVLRNPYLPVSR